MSAVELVAASVNFREFMSCHLCVAHVCVFRM